MVRERVQHLQRLDGLRPDIQQGAAGLVGKDGRAPRVDRMAIEQPKDDPRRLGEGEAAELRQAAGGDVIVRFGVAGPLWRGRRRGRRGEPVALHRHVAVAAGAERRLVVDDPPAGRIARAPDDRRAGAVARAHEFGRLIAHVPRPVRSAHDEDIACAARGDETVGHQQGGRVVAEIGVDGQHPASLGQPEGVVDAGQGVRADVVAHGDVAEQDIDVVRDQPRAVEGGPGRRDHEGVDRLVRCQHVALVIAGEQRTAGGRMGLEPVEDRIVVGADRGGQRMAEPEHADHRGRRRAHVDRAALTVLDRSTRWACSAADTGGAICGAGRWKCFCSMISAVCNAPSTQPCSCE